MGRRVLIPIDGSKNSERAFDFALAHILRSDDQLLLLHITATPHLPTFSLENPLSLPVDEWSAKLQAAIKEGQKLVEQYEIKCEERKLAKTSILESGKPGEGVCKVASEKNADMIVMGSRGLNAIRRTFVGSVSDYVLHHATIPVTIVPPEK